MTELRMLTSKNKV